MAVFNKPQFNTVWASEGVKSDPGVAKVGQGWVVEIPPHEYANWLENRRDAMLAHINQAGIVAWDSSVEYQAGKSYVQSPSGVVFKSLTTHTGVDPDLDVNGNWEVAFQRSGEALLKSQNLADVPDKAQARTNLGIATTADYDSRFLRQVQNLADLPSKPTARGNLGLGDSSTRNVGTASGTVAAGDDGRIVNAVQTSRTITAGGGLVGGGNLSDNRVLSLGTPSSITTTSANSVSVNTHTHSLDVGSFLPTRYVDVKSSRTPETFYTNTSGKIKFISVCCEIVGNNAAALALEVDGIIVSQQLNRYMESSKIANVFGVLFPGSRYRITSIAGSVRVWVETE